MSESSSRRVLGSECSFVQPKDGGGDKAAWAERRAVAVAGGLPDGTSLWLLGSAFDVQDPEASAIEQFRGSEVAIPEPT